MTTFSLTFFPYVALAQETSLAPDASTEKQEIVVEPEVVTKETSSVRENEPIKELGSEPETGVTEENITEDTNNQTILEADLSELEETVTVPLDEKSSKVKESNEKEIELPTASEISADLSQTNETVIPSFEVEEMEGRDPLIKEKIVIDSFKESAAHSKEFNSLVKNFTFTDDNVGENLIIKSDKRDYIGLTEQEIYFSITNTGESSELVNVQAYFPHDKGEVVKLEQWVEDIPLVNGKPYLAEDRIQCDSGFEPLTISNDTNLSLVKRYVNSFVASLVKTSKVFAQVIEGIISPEPEPEPEPEPIEPSESFLPIESNSGLITPSEDVGSVESETHTTHSESQSPVSGADTEPVSESENIQVLETPIEQSTEEKAPTEETTKHLESEALTLSQSVEDSTTGKNKQSETENSNLEELGEDKIQEESRGETAEGEATPPIESEPFTLEGRYYCSDIQEEFSCRYLTNMGKTCITKMKNGAKDRHSRKYDSWRPINLATKKLSAPNSLMERITGDTISPKYVPGSLSVEKSTRLDRRNPYIKALEPGETGYYKMSIRFPIDSSGEFYIEAFGDNDGYGLLDPFWNSSWNYRQTITIDNTSSTETLSDYQIFVEIDSNQVDFWEDVKSDGGDIRFLNATDTTELDFFMLHFDYTNQIAQFWVKVDSISAASLSEIYLYYGNSLATTTSSPENTFSSSAKEPRWYELSSDSIYLGAFAVTFFDNNDFQVGQNGTFLYDTDWDTGDAENTKDIALAYAGIGAIASSTKPFTIQVEPHQEAELWLPAAWQSKEFVTAFSRTDSRFFLMNPGNSDANVQIFKDGTLIDSFVLAAGTHSKRSGYAHTDDAHWRITSSVPILATQWSYYDTDHGILAPPGLEHHGIKRNLHIICSQDDTVVNIYYSDLSSDQNMDCDRNEVWVIPGGGALGSGPSYRAVANKPIHTYSYDDGDGTSSEMQPGYRTQDLDIEYAISLGSVYVSCSAPYDNTIISWKDIDRNEISNSGNLGANGINYPSFYKFATNDYSSKIITSNYPIYCYQDTIDNQTENSMGNRVMNRKPASIIPTVSIGIQEQNFPDTPIITMPFDYEKVPTGTPSFEFSSVESEGDDLVYQIRWDTDNTFTSPTVRTSDTDPGFENLDTPGDTSPFNEGENIRFTIQAADTLTNGTTYWYQVRAKDPTDSNRYSDWTTRKSITVDTSVQNSTWYQTTDEQFSEQGVLNMTSVDGEGGVQLSPTNSINYIDVQRTELTLATSELTKDWILPEAISSVENAFIIMYGRMTDGNLQRVQAKVEFINTSTVRVTRAQSGTAATFTLQVIEANQEVDSPAFSVQHGSLTFNGLQTQATIPSVDVSQSMVLVHNTISADNRAVTQVKAELNSATTVLFSRASSTPASSVGLTYQVVTWNSDVNLQKGTIDMTGTLTAYQDIYPISRCCSMVFATYSADDDSISQASPRVWLSSGTRVEVDRTSASALGKLSLRYAVVSFPYEVDVRRDNNVSSPTLNTSVDVTFTTPLGNLAHVFNIHSNKTSGSGTSHPKSYVTSFLSNTSTLQLREDYAGETKTVSYYVADTNGWYYSNTELTGTILSPEIIFEGGNRDANNSGWNEVSFTSNETHGDIKLKLYYTVTTACDTIVPDTDLPGNSNGFDTNIDISMLDTTSYAKICLKAEFVNTGTGSPKLLDWGVTWGEGSGGATLPSLTTEPVTSITDTSAIGNGTVVNDGGAPVTQRGFVWNTLGNPTIGDSGVTSPGTTGVFSASLTSLTAETLYYVRAYATNSEGTSYGNEVTFTTDEAAVPQTLSFNLSDNTIGFGILDPLQSRFASGDGLGSTSPSSAHTITASTNAENGYVISFHGSGLECSECGSSEIDPIGLSPQSPIPGTEQYGLSAEVVIGTGSVSTEYGQSGKYAFPTSSSTSTLGTGPGDSNTTVYNVSYMSNITPATTAGEYESVLTYTVTATF